MSRLVKIPIHIPKGTEVKIEKKNVSAKGAKGTFALTLHEGIDAKVEDGKVYIIPKIKDGKRVKALIGLQWALVRNLITGVTKGYEIRLNLIGVGFRAELKGVKLDLKVGYSHPTFVSIPKGITVKVEKGTEIIISGVDKQLVGQFASEVRAVKKPEPYKGKGIRYKNEYVRKKAGKAAKGKA